MILGFTLVHAAYSMRYIVNFIFRLGFPGNIPRLPFKRLTGVRRIFSSGVYLLSTNPARPSLTSVIGRELVYSKWYDANRKTVIK